MAISHQVSGSSGTRLKVLQRTKEVCAEAFRLISSDDARSEGFFRSSKPVLDENLVKKIISRKGVQQTPAGIYLLDDTLVRPPNPKLLEAISDAPPLVLCAYLEVLKVEHLLALHNPSFSVNSGIAYKTREYDSPDFFKVVNVYVEGITTDDTGVRIYRFSLTPIDTPLGILLGGQFDARELTIAEFRNLFEGGGAPRGRSLIDYDKINKSGSTLVSELHARIISEYPEGNYELTRISLNLLAEFESMLNSGIKHLEVEKLERSS